MQAPAPEPQVATLDLARVREVCWSDTPDGYELFYTLIFGRALPSHGRRWVEKIYAAWRAGKGAIIRGFRGSTKTTIISNGFVAYYIGLHPHLSNVIVQASDPKAHDNAQAVALIIETNPAWKAIFPHVVPDKDVSWGEKGYEVKRTDLDYGEFRRKRTKDPTLAGYGITSSSLIGGHPDGLLVLDDIHDEENTRSTRERDHVLTKLTGTVLPMAIPRQTRKIVAGTPWVEGDALDYLEATGEYEVVSEPIYREAEEHEAGAVFLDVLGSKRVDKWIIPAWPEERPVEVIQSLRREWGPVDFPRMGLLDLSRAKSGLLTFQSFPAALVNLNWPMVGGADPAGTVNPEKGRDLDFFAHCYGAKPPGGGLIIVGGEYGRLTQAQGEVMLAKPQSVFKHWSHTVIEGDGKGEEAFQLALRNPGLRIVMRKTGNRPFHERISKELAPHLDLGAIRISDADTPFLNRLRYEIEHYPNLDHDDCLSALFWCMRAAPDALVVAATPEGEARPRTGRRGANPFAALAGQRV